jgi:hypothetical protein
MEASTPETIEMKWDYLGNKSERKRVIWIKGTTDFIWGDEFVEWAREKKRQGYKIFLEGEDKIVREY